MDAPRITEDWLRDCGFKWEQHERQPSKHWLLWIGSACVDYDRTTSPDSLGLELATVDTTPEGYQGLWYCWIRNDIAGRYSRLIHVRYVYLQSEVEQIISALTGRAVNWKDSLYGSLHAPLQANHLRQDTLRGKCSCRYLRYVNYGECGWCKRRKELLAAYDATPVDTLTK